MKQILTWLFIILALLIVLAIDSGLLPGLGLFWSRMNMSLTIALYLLIVFQTNLAYTFYLAILLLTSLTVSNLFLIPLIAGFLTLIGINLLLERFLTNRSYYVIVTLGGLGWLFYHLIFGLQLLLYGLLAPEATIIQLQWEWVVDIVLLTFVVIGLFTAGYIATSFMSKRFRSYFIISDH